MAFADPQNCEKQVGTCKGVSKAAALCVGDSLIKSDTDNPNTSPSWPMSAMGASAMGASAMGASAMG